MRLKVFIFSVFIGIIIIFSLRLFVKSVMYTKPESHIYIISSGSQGGNYYKAGIYLEKTLNNTSPCKCVFKAITSTGSIENIKRLKERFTDFAIVQRDILIKNFYGNGDKIKNVSIIAPLFQEKFLIYTHEKGAITFGAFKKYLKTSPRKIKIGVTSIDGTAYETFSHISELLSESLENVEFVEENYKKLAEDFADKRIDIVLTFSLPLKKMEQENAGVVYFNNKDIRLLISRMRYFSQATVVGNQKYETLGVWALLIGLNKSIENVGDERIIKSLASNKKIDNYIASQIGSTLVSFRSTPSLFDQYLSSLPTTQAFLSFINRDKHYSYLYYILTSLILGIFLYFYKNFITKRQKQWRYLWIRYNHIIIGIVIIIISYLLCLEYLIYSEEVFFKATAIKSPILDLTRTDLHIWNIIRIFAQNDNGIFPLSLYGKLVTTLSTYVIFFGAAAIFTSEFIIYKLIENRREGKMQVKYKNHIIISGWSNNTSKLIKELLSSAKKYHNRSFKIVCVVPDPIFILNNENIASDKEYERKITFVKGDLRNKNIALQCNAFFASAIILLAEDSSIHADEKTLMRALSVTKFNCKQPALSLNSGSEIANNIEALTFKAAKKINATYIIAEVNNEEFVDDLRNAGVNGIVNRGEIIEGVLVQSLLNPGVSTLLNNILSFSADTNEFYTVNLKDIKNSNLRNKTFDELLLPLRKEKILLIAIKIVYLDETDKEIVDEEELALLLERDGLKRQIITNPINRNETERKADSDDQLIVLAADKSRLDSGLLKVKF